MAQSIQTQNRNVFERSRFLAACALSLALVAIPAGAAQLQAIKSHVPSAAVAQSRVMGPVTDSATLTLAIGLPLRNQAQLDTLLEQISDQIGRAHV